MLVAIPKEVSQDPVPCTLSDRGVALLTSALADPDRSPFLFDEDLVRSGRTELNRKGHRQAVYEVRPLGATGEIEVVAPALLIDEFAHLKYLEGTFNHRRSFGFVYADSFVALDDGYEVQRRLIPRLATLARELPALAPRVGLSNSEAAVLAARCASSASHLNIRGRSKYASDVLRTVKPFLRVSEATAAARAIAVLLQHDFAQVASKHGRVQSSDLFRVYESAGLPGGFSTKTLPPWLDQAGIDSALSGNVRRFAIADPACRATAIVWCASHLEGEVVADA